VVVTNQIKSFSASMFVSIPRFCSFRRQFWTQAVTAMRYLHVFQSRLSISGVDSVRAYKAEERFKALFEALIDVNHRCYILFVHGSRWLGVRLDLLAALCVTVAATCVLVLRNHLAPGIAGVVLVQSQLTGLFQVSFRDIQISTSLNVISDEKLKRRVFA
jgi:hypothetical protein